MEIGNDWFQTEHQGNWSLVLFRQQRMSVGDSLHILWRWFIFSPSEFIFKKATTGLEYFSTLKTFNFLRSLSKFSDTFWLTFCLWFVKLLSAVTLSLPTLKSEFCCHSFNKNFLKFIAKVEIQFSCRCYFSLPDNFDWHHCV